MGCSKKQIRKNIKNINKLLFECALGNHKCTIPKKGSPRTFICACGKKGYWSNAPNDYIQWYDYDNKGNEIYWKDSTNFEQWANYDDKGNRIYWKNSNGYEAWADYDDKGNRIHLKDSLGYEEWLGKDGYGVWIGTTQSKGWKYAKYI